MIGEQKYIKLSAEEQRIRSRIEKDREVQEMRRQQKMDSSLKYKADWMSKSSGIQRLKETGREVERMRGEMRSRLEERRQRLRELLGREEEEIVAEIKRLKKTPEQVRAEMRAEYQELKKQNEEEKSR